MGEFSELKRLEFLEDGIGIVKFVNLFLGLVAICVVEYADLLGDVIALFGGALDLVLTFYICVNLHLVLAKNVNLLHIG